MVDKKRIMILLSGRGSNFIALADHLAKNPHHHIVAVASDNAASAGLATARERGFATLLLDYGRGRDNAEQQLRNCIEQKNIYYILLAGFMKILSPAFVAIFKNRILNIHPSLLPHHRGLDTHQRVIVAGDKEHGCSVHVVTAGVDEGLLLAQRRLKVMPHDTATTLADKVLVLEHELYSFVLENIETLMTGVES